MIRWYDYIVAIIAADFILGLVLWGLNATTWWEPIVAGLLAGMIWQLWKNEYCKFRLKQENNKDA
jgi:hypothetical protein